MVKQASQVPSRRHRLLIAVSRFVAADAFFWCMVGLFVLQAGWIALSARYPQAFDEQFHFGLIQFYSHHLSPFLNAQPTTIDQYGAAFRDPSYLYHYLLSFPYRALVHLTSSQTTQVIVLRFLNIGFFVSGLIVFRKLLRACMLSRGLTNISLAFLAFTPVMPLLASQINYDNLLFPLSGLTLLLALRSLLIVRQTKHIAWSQFTIWLGLGLLACLVKYAFLPIIVVLIFVTVFAIVKHAMSGFWADLWLWLRRPISWLFIAGLLVCVLLFLQRYGLNTIRYHTPIPECNQVLSIDRCMSYTPWQRNYTFSQSHIALGPLNILTYPFIWIYHMMGEMIFTITSSFDQAGTVQYTVGAQLIVIELLSWAIFGIGVLCLLRYGAWLWRQRPFRLLLIVSIGYLALLGYQNFTDYIHVGIPVAIHGRYLLPVLPILYAAVGLLVQHLIDERFTGASVRTQIKAGLTIVCVVILLFEGGGFVTYIVRSNPSWFWPQNTKLQNANAKVRGVLKPLVIDAKKP